METGIAEWNRCLLSVAIIGNHPVWYWSCPLQMTCFVKSEKKFNEVSGQTTAVRVLVKSDGHQMDESWNNTVVVVYSGNRNLAIWYRIAAYGIDPSTPLRNQSIIVGHLTWRCKPYFGGLLLDSEVVSYFIGIRSKVWQNKQQIKSYRRGTILFGMSYVGPMCIRINRRILGCFYDRLGRPETTKIMNGVIINWIDSLSCIDWLVCFKKKTQGYQSGN